MVCQKCGSSINDATAKFCANCGAEIVKSISEKNTKISLDEHVNKVMGEVLQKSLKGTAAKEINSRGKYFLYGLVLLIIIGTYFLYGK